MKWYKGNLHTHTLNSDGDSTPLEVATWYREHGYQFLVLTDHNYLTDVTGLNSFMAASEKFLLIPGARKLPTPTTEADAHERIQSVEAGGADPWRQHGRDDPERPERDSPGGRATVAESP